MIHWLAIEGFPHGAAVVALPLMAFTVMQHIGGTYSASCSA